MYSTCKTRKTSQLQESHFSFHCTASSQCSSRSCPHFYTTIICFCCTSYPKTSAVTWIAFSSYENPSGFMITICCIQAHQVQPPASGLGCCSGTLRHIALEAGSRQALVKRQNKNHSKSNRKNIETNKKTGCVILIYQKKSFQKN